MDRIIPLISASAMFAGGIPAASWVYDVSRKISSPSLQMSEVIFEVDACKSWANAPKGFKALISEGELPC